MASQEPPRVEIIVISGPSKGGCFEFQQDSIRLGRNPDNDVALTREHSVSGEHARIVCVDGSWWLRDLSSTNGSYVQEKGSRSRVDGGTLLESGQVFVLGKVRLQFNLADRAKRAEGPPAEGSPADFAAKDGLLLRAVYRDGVIAWGVSGLDEHAPGLECPVRDQDVGAINRSLRTMAKLASEGLDSAEAQAKTGPILGQAGTYLRDRFVAPAVREQLDALEEGLVRLDHNPALANLPWEALLTGGKLMGLRFDMSRELLAKQAPPPPPEGPVNDVLQVLIVGDPGGDMPEALDAANRLADALAKRPDGTAVRLLTGAKASKETLIELLPATHVACFFAPPFFDQKRAPKSGWALAHGTLSAVDFKRLPSQPRVVYSAYCETGDTPHHTGRVLPQAHMAAASFRLAGVANFVGPVWDVPAPHTGAFAAEFVRNLLKGRTASRAVRRARRMVCKQYGAHDLTWIRPVLYGPPSHAIAAGG